MRVAFLKLMLVVVALASLYGCASAPQFTASVGPASGNGVVYVYRPSKSFASLGCSKFAIDGGAVHPLPNGEFVRLELPKGRHLLKSHNSWCSVFPLERAFTLEDGEVLFVKLNVMSDWRPGFVRYGGRDDIYQGYEIVPSALATEELKKL